MEKKEAHVEWMAHYIDYFITMGAPGSNECASNFTQMHTPCDQMGSPVEPGKEEGPATALSFLGIELDSIAIDICIPPEKLNCLRKELAAWKACKKCRKRENSFH